MRKKEAYRERTYRVSRPPKGLVGFSVRYKQSDLWIQADRDIRTQAERILQEVRMQLEAYGKANPVFFESHRPMALDKMSPPIVQQMMEGALMTGVGPMAAVAGAIAQSVGEAIRRCCAQVIVENGGDLYVHSARSVTVGLFAGPSPFGSRLGFRIGREAMPVGISTSSASIGHSWSYGSADAACVIAENGALADAAATALCNRIRSASDMGGALQWVQSISGIKGSLVAMGKSLAVQGDMELVPIADAEPTMTGVESV